MLGWALKKGFQGATGLRDAPEDTDTTQLDAPDTPAPVFAARAIRNAIWGPSAATDDQPTDSGRVKPAQSTSNAAKAIPADTRSPTKLNSILLTPGTGTSRRKRVSFGGDVKAANNTDSSPLAATSSRHGRSRRRTTLQQALENSRPVKPKEPPQEPEASAEENTEEESEWEDEDICCNHDVTVDLNEPHSESGKYWKAQWSRYREEAKSDIEQLVKYKANARSFAAKKDMEASQLSQKLKEEQAKVKHGTDKDSALLAEDLARQTSLVTEYRERVKDLETRLTEASSKANSDRHSHQRIDTSPRTEQNILEVSRELRKARSELRELDRLRDEVKRLKSSLATSRERVAELEIQASSGKTKESSRAARLEEKLREVKEESRQKDSKIKKLERDYQTLKSDAKARTAEAMQVVQGKDIRIAELQKKLEDMKAIHVLNQPKDSDAAITDHAKTYRDIKPRIESLDKPSRYGTTRPSNRHTRATSVQEFTFNMTEDSLIGEKDNKVLSDTPRAKKDDIGVLTDWTADIPTFELQVQGNKKIHKSDKFDDQLIMADVDPLPPRQPARDTEQQSLYDDLGGIPDVLSNRVNESSRRQSRRLPQSDIIAASSVGNDYDNADQPATNEDVASLIEEKPVMRGALDQPS
ncbi:hypothetical protein NPX13_g5937 [Xylaria arbuscula]|uniref:Spindle pole body-associated protein cut12 domain-containing protein n=1 Tax=Xylaria arbuscula TaxID=114810 RepID=A0A9W8ND77_9PEZI|nr:hypothetical protein NPX13_g5937 [Xylaria arbuscula]